MKKFLFHVAYFDNQCNKRYKSTEIHARNLIHAHQAGRKLVSLLLCDSEISEVVSCHLECLKS